MLRIRGGHPDISWMDDLIVDERTIPLKTLFFFFFPIYALFALDDHHGQVWSWCYNTPSVAPLSMSRLGRCIT